MKHNLRKRVAGIFTYTKTFRRVRRSEKEKENKFPTLHVAVSHTRNDKLTKPGVGKIAAAYIITMEAHLQSAHLESLVTMKFLFLFKKFSILRLHNFISFFVSCLILLAFASINFLVDGHWSNVIRFTVKQRVSIVD